MTGLSQKILSGDRNALSKAITLIESSLPEYAEEAEKILEEILPHTGKSIRIGITGVPGVGKSTFIEALGNFLIEQHQKKIGVLAIDPSSSISKGSILGDKTRMEKLSRSENAFIRPSPSGGKLGGVAFKTRESILLCEAAGYDVIFVETVGVGQSEIAVHAMVDFMLLLLLPGAGDELQGMKRGIIEMADLLAINKADGDNVQKAKVAKAAYTQALHLFPSQENGWQPQVLLCSSISGDGVKEIWEKISVFLKTTTGNNFFAKRRKDQRKYWLREKLLFAVYKRFEEDPEVKRRLPELEKMVEEGKMSVTKAVNDLLSRDTGQGAKG